MDHFFAHFKVSITESSPDLHSCLATIVTTPVSCWWLGLHWWWLLLFSLQSSHLPKRQKCLWCGRT